MEERFYTIDQVAEILGMHHKTIRKFITEGRLRANKCGKQWRISGHDLSIFVESNDINVKHSQKVESDGIEFSTGKVDNNSQINKVNISTVVDINEVDSDEYKRTSNMLLAVMNTKDSKLANSTINLKYYQTEKNLKIMLWGNMEFIKEMLDLIDMLIQSKEN